MTGGLVVNANMNTREVDPSLGVDAHNEGEHGSDSYSEAWTQAQAQPEPSPSRKPGPGSKFS